MFQRGASLNDHTQKVVSGLQKLKLCLLNQELRFQPQLLFTRWVVSVHMLSSFTKHGQLKACLRVGKSRFTGV